MNRKTVALAIAWVDVAMGYRAPDAPGAPGTAVIVKKTQGELRQEAMDALTWDGGFEGYNNVMKNLTQDDVRVRHMWPGTRYDDTDSLGDGEDWQRSYKDGQAPMFRFGANFGESPEEVHFNHRLFQAFYVIYGKKKIGRNAEKDLALWQSFYIKFSRYGCYCFTRGPIAKGQGVPVDELDKACRSLNRCEKCIDIDSEAGVLPETCVAHQGYTYRARIDRQTNKPYIYCHKNNGPCQQAACQCDRMFSMQVAELIKSWNADFVDVVDQDGQCEKPVMRQLSGASDVCCGVYPKREPYHSEGDRQCCGTLMYNVKRKDCCSVEESLIQPVGTCDI